MIIIRLLLIALLAFTPSVFSDVIETDVIEDIAFDGKKFQADIVSAAIERTLRWTLSFYPLS